MKMRLFKLSPWLATMAFTVAAIILVVLFRYSRNDGIWDVCQEFEAVSTGLQKGPGYPPVFAYWISGTGGEGLYFCSQSISNLTRIHCQKAMDLETENRLAAMLMEEARRLRLQAENEGVHAYLKPNVRARPNSRFLTATVLGVQQANRAVEVSEMWRARDKELELDSRPRDISKNSSRPRSEKHHNGHVEGRLQSRHEEKERVCASRLKSRPEENGKISASRLKSKQKENVKVSASLCSSSKRAYEDSYPDKDGMQDEEIEKFLHSRRKRGKGAIGSRMDEPGPYLSTSLNDNERLLLPADVREKEEWEKRIVGPEKPSFMQTKEHLNDSHNSTDSEDDTRLYEKHHVKKHISKKDKSKKKKRKEKRSKHHNKKQKQKIR